MTKPLTKALHTVRVVRLLAEHQAAISADEYTPDSLLDEVLEILENDRPTDPVLLAECLKACGKALELVAELRKIPVYIRSVA